MRIPLPFVQTWAFVVLTASPVSAGELLRELRIGRAGHAFDHLGAIGEQAETAAASGATIIYGTGFGSLGYQGLPPKNELSAKRAAVRDYNRKAKRNGIRLVLGYLCATSIVKLDSFDRNWAPELREKFKSPPSAWRQVDRQGHPLPSWYGGDYQPACMNHPDWRRYQTFMVRQQLESGHDGIFFDNPTVHPQGCYCEHCMEKFADFLRQTGSAPPHESVANADAIRQLTDHHPKEFLRFRCTIARDFLAAMRTFARTINGNALVTCNNSLNSRDSFFSQCRTYGYNIAEMSQVEDWVVVEDMSSQPRIKAGGQTIEYGPCYKMLHAISHGKPVVAVTLVESDYHTPPNLVRLAMAEAAAHGASYLSWPTWPENQRQRMIAAIEPQAALLRHNEALLNETSLRADVVLFFPFRRWVDTDKCTVTSLATALSRMNVQYEVIAEDAFPASIRAKPPPVFLVESLAVLTPDKTAALERFQKDGGRVVAADKEHWLKETQEAISHPSLILRGPPTVRAAVRDQVSRTIVHLYNLNVERLASFEDRVHPATNLRLTVKVPFAEVRAVDVRTADAGGTAGAARFTPQRRGDETLVEIAIPRLEIGAIVVIEPQSQ